MNILSRITYVLGVATALWVLWFAYFTSIDIKLYGLVFVGLSITYYYLNQLTAHLGDADDDSVDVNASKEGSNDDVKVAGIDWDRVIPTGLVEKLILVLNPLLIAVSIAVTVYLVVNFERLMFDAPAMGYRELDYFVGFAAIAMVLDITNREFGSIITGVVVATFVYGLIGPWLPGVLYHSGMSPREIIEVGSVSMSGVFGFLLDIGATLVAIFILLAGMARSYGAMDAVMDIGAEFRHVFQSGVVQVAVVSSMIMGSITGAAAANVATTGSFTIPMMIKQGVDRKYAAAIESIASSAGQLIPPIMGVAAFLMADIVGIPYLSVVRAGLLPALLYFVALVIAIELAVRKFGWTVSSSGSFDVSVFRKAAIFAIPFGILVYLLGYLQYSALTSGFYTIMALVIVAFARDIYQFSANGDRSITTLWTPVKNTANGLKAGIDQMAPLIAIITALGFAITMITYSGLSQRLGSQFVLLAGGTLLGVLILAMVTSIVFGMGMPTPAAYLLVAVIIAPAMVNFGIEPLVSHMFVFYFAVLSAITPPIAVAVVVGADIAESDFIQTAFTTVYLALPIFLVPFVFITYPEIILWEYPATILSLILIVPGIFGMSVTAAGYDGIRKIGYGMRGLYFLITLAILFAPSVPLRLGAIVVIAALYLLRRVGIDKQLSVSDRV